MLVRLAVAFGAAWLLSASPAALGQAGVQGGGGGAGGGGAPAAAELDEAASAVEGAAAEATEAAQDVQDAAGDVAASQDGGVDSSGDLQLPDDMTDVNAWVAIFIEYGVPALAAIGKALAVLVLGWILATWAARFIRRQGDKRAKLDTTLSRFLAQIARWAILAMAFIAALGIVGIGTASFAALLAAAGLAIGLALQGSLSNFAAGVMILMFRPYRVGQYITAGGESGTVDEIQLLTTTLDTPDNVRVIVPNSAVFSGTITNYSHHAIRRCDVSVGTEYSADLDRVRQVLEGVIEEIEERVTEKESMVFLDKLGSSSIDWVLRIWVPSSDFWPLKQRITALTKKRLDEAGIGIPFPQMDVHLDKLNG